MILGKHGGQEIDQPPDIYLLSGMCLSMTRNERNEEKNRNLKKGVHLLM